MPSQDSWRRCGKCIVLFFDGFPNKGRCPAGGGHARTNNVKTSQNFFLPHDVPESKTAQAGWRFCHKCHMMFFDGFLDNKGQCPGGGGHEAAGFNFVLPHFISLKGTQPKGLVQTRWRFCQKCNAMFFNGETNKGRCAAGGGHEAAGFHFVLPFKGNLSDDQDLIPVDE